MFYTIYRITNLINGKSYTGKHETTILDDGYMGSGVLLRRAIEKHGVENFKKEYLEILDSKEKMNLAEKIYVVVDKEVSYNLKRGGEGGWDFINENGLNFNIEKNKKISPYSNPERYSKEQLENWKEKQRIGFEKAKRDGVFENKRVPIEGAIKGREKALSAESRDKRKQSFKKINHQQKEKNSQFGTCWITNGRDNKKIMKSDIDIWIQQGYYKGRIIGSD